MLTWQIHERGRSRGDESTGLGLDFTARDCRPAAGVKDLAECVDGLAKGHDADEVNVELDGDDIMTDGCEAGGGHALAGVEQGGDYAAVDDTGRTEVLGFGAKGDVGATRTDRAGLDAQVLVEWEATRAIRLGQGFRPDLGGVEVSPGTATCVRR